MDEHEGAVASDENSEDWESISSGDLIDGEDGDGYEDEDVEQGQDTAVQSSDEQLKAEYPLGCEHYRRRVKLVAPCCDEVFWCRHCHNTEKHDNATDFKTAHMLDRTKVEEVVCGTCEFRQPVAARCCSCLTEFGRYTCLKCRFFDDDIRKGQYHCDKCGICRVGGRDNFFHCDTCSACYSVRLRANHKCIENAMKSNCPVCTDYLFDSVRSTAVLPCGHTLHQACHQELLRHNTYTCPVCTCCFLAGEEARRMWAHLDAVVAQTQMPPEYAAMRVSILCNDCHARSSVSFHVVGHKCSSEACGSYNTRRV